MLKKQVWGVAIIVTYIALTTVIIKKYSADIAYKNSAQKFRDGALSAAYKKISEAIEKNPSEPEYYRQRAKVNTALENKPGALQDLQTAKELNPKNLAILRDSIPLYFFLATGDLKRPASPENIDPEYLQVTSRYYGELKSYLPNDLGLYVAIAKYEKRLGLQNEHAETLAQIKALRPDLLEWHPDLIE